MQITPEVLKEIQACKSADELIAKAAEAGIDLPPQTAEMLLTNVSPVGDLDLEALDSVAGGSCSSSTKNMSAEEKRAMLEKINRISRLPQII